MLDNLIGKIIALLPPQIREKLPERFQEEKLGDDDKTGDVKIDTGDETQVDAIDEESKESSDEDSDEDDELDELDLKAQKRSRLIKIIVIGAIIWFGLDIMTEKPEVAKKSVKSKSIKKKKGIKKKADTVVEKKAEKKNEEVAISPKGSSQEQVPIVDKPVSEPVVIPAPEIVEPVVKPVIEPVVIPDEKIVEPMDKQAEAVVPVVVPTPPMLNIELPDSSLLVPSSEDKLGEQGEEENIDNEIDKLFAEEVSSQEVEKSELPDFERVGAGLVYNCKNKHWACLDRKNYFLCRDLELAVGNGRPDCAIVETYSTVKDCQVMQVYKVNRANAPDACKFEN